MTTFRVHYQDGSHLDVPAETPAQAQAAAAKQNPGALVSKVKVLRAAA